MCTITSNHQLNRYAKELTRDRKKRVIGLRRNLNIPSNEKKYGNKSCSLSGWGFVITDPPFRATVLAADMCRIICDNVYIYYNTSNNDT